FRRAGAQGPLRSRRTTGARACTAGGAGSHSRASLPAAARRTQASRRAAPEHDAAAEAHAARLHVDDPGLSPEAGEVVPCTEPADRRSEEAHDLAPAG